MDMQVPTTATGALPSGGMLQLALGVPGLPSPVALQLNLHGGAGLQFPIGNHVLTVQINDAGSQRCAAAQAPAEDPVLKAPKIRKIVHRGRPMYRIILPAAWCRLLGRKIGSSVFAGTKESAEDSLKHLKVQATKLIAKGASTGQPVAGAAVAVLPGSQPSIQNVAIGAKPLNLGSQAAPAPQKAVETWTEHRKSFRSEDSTTQRTEEYQMRKFLNGFINSTLPQITATGYETWLGGVKEINVNSKIRLTGTVKLFFDFCVREGWVATNPISQVNLPQRQQDLPEISSIDDVEKLLWAGLQSSSPILPGFVLQLFAGYRRKEYLRGSWPKKNPKARFLTVRGGHAKTHKGRQAPIFETTRAWLAEIWPDTPGAFAPHEKMTDNEEWYQIELTKVRALAGLTRWPHNVLRHLYASYHYAKYNDYERLAREMGNTKDEAQKYVVLLDEPQDEERYWRITPDYLRAKFGGASKAVPPTPMAPESAKA